MDQRTFTAVLTDRALLGVSGPDARGFLQGLLTQDVEQPFEHQLRYGALLTPQGRLRCDLFLTTDDDTVVLDVAAGGREELIAALKLYRLRAKVEIAALDAPVVALWGEVSAAPDRMQDPRLPALGFRGFGMPVDGGDDYTAHRLALGVADLVVDGAEPLYPIEANIDLLNGIDFKKGCFVGQETTSRMKRRGQIKTRIAPILHDGPMLPPGAEVLTDAGQRAGKVLSGMAGRSLALLRIDRSSGAVLSVDDRPVRLDIPAWLAPAFTMAAGAALA